MASSTPLTQLPSLVPSAPPDATEVDRIAAMAPPVERNLCITQCYFELSAAFARRTGAGANWCTFATWASKQAGQTVRRQDLLRTLEGLLQKEPGVAEALNLIVFFARQLGTRLPPEEVRTLAIWSFLEGVSGRASAAVSRGNKKVFEEIGREFARFLAACAADTEFTPAHLDAFCRPLRPGDPPEGQEYLRRAFTRYYASFFEPDDRKRAELRLLANLEIGFHEQTRLQPEIFESLNAAAAIVPQAVKERLLDLLFPATSYPGRLQRWFGNLFRDTAILDRPVARLVQHAQGALRTLLTAHLMTLALPDDCLRLGKDLSAPYPAHLQQLLNDDLLALLKMIDPTPDSLRDSGAADWADLRERLHYIADLFRCYHEDGDLFAAPFTEAQTAEIKAGRMPAGRL